MSPFYNTLSSPCEGLIIEKLSKFYGYAYPITSKEDVASILKSLQQSHPKSRHICYAYRLGDDKTNFRANDDGEPSGSAGKPILNQIDSFELTDVLIVIVRYFGGTKLGKSGLTSAYKLSAKVCLENGTIIGLERRTQLTLSVEMEHYHKAQELLKSANALIISEVFTEIITIQLEIGESQRKMLMQNKWIDIAT